MVIYALHTIIYAPTPIKPSYHSLFCLKNAENIADGINMVINYQKQILKPR